MVKLLVVVVALVALAGCETLEREAWKEQQRQRCMYGRGTADECNHINR